MEKMDQATHADFANLRGTSFGILNRIYASSLPYTLKHHYACRQLCLKYKAMSASLLLYDGNKDQLISNGVYLNREALKVIPSGTAESLDNKILRSEKRHMLRFIAFYHYLFYWFTSTGIRKISDEEANQIFDSFKEMNYITYGFPKKLEIVSVENGAIVQVECNTTSFVQFCIGNSMKNAADYNGNLDTDKFYAQIKKKLIDEDAYQIGINADNLPGSVFAQYVQANSFRKSDQLIFETEDTVQVAFGDKTITPRSNLFKENLAQIGFHMRDSPYEVAIPLITNNRCIGILRLIYCLSENRNAVLKRKSSKFGSPVMLYSRDGNGIKGYLLSKHNRRSLLYAVEILSNMIDQNYQQSYMERIPRNFESTGNLSNEDLNAEYNSWCTNLQKAINCKGCMLRLRDPGISFPSRRGYSNSIKNFVDYTDKHLQQNFLFFDRRFHPELENIFPDVNVEKIPETKTGNRNKNKIVGVLIDIPSDYKRTKVIRYYYCEEGKEEVRPVNKISDISPGSITAIDPLRSDLYTSLLTQEYHALFTGKISIGDKPVHSGKYLLIIDIPAIDVSGVVTFSNSANRRFTLSDVRYAYGQIKRFGLGISLRNRQLTQLALRASLHPMANVIRELNQMIEIAEKHNLPIHETQRFKIIKQKYESRCRDIEMLVNSGNNYKESHSKKEETPYCVLEFLGNKIENQKYDASLKGLEIKMEMNALSYLPSRVNKQGLWKSLEGIIDNAINYSETSPDMSSPRQILIDLQQADGNTLIIKVSNDGRIITNEEALRLGELYTSLEDVTGERGQGLFIVRKHLELINSEWIIPQPTARGSQFGIKIKL